MSNLYIGAYLVFSPPEKEIEGPYRCPGCRDEIHPAAVFAGYKFCHRCGSRYEQAPNEKRRMDLNDLLGDDDQELFQPYISERAFPERGIALPNVHKSLPTHIKIDGDLGEWKIEPQMYFDFPINFRQVFARQINKLEAMSVPYHIEFGALLWTLL